MKARTAWAAVADIAGKGIPAALLLTYTRAFFRQSVRRTQSPAAIARSLSDALLSDTGGNPYVTCIIAAFDLDRRVLTCTNAGHPPAVVVGPDGPQSLGADGPPAGLLASVSYGERQVPLREGDVGVFVTDGITEGFDGDLATIAAALRQKPHVTGRALADAVCADLFDLASRSSGPAGLDGWSDDRTVLAFAVGPRR